MYKYMYTHICRKCVGGGGNKKSSLFLQKLIRRRQRNILAAPAPSVTLICVEACTGRPGATRPTRAAKPMSYCAEKGEHVQHICSIDSEILL